MRVFQIFCFVFALLFASCSYAFTQTKVKVIVFGDSLTSGFQIGKEGAYAVRLKEKLEKAGFTDFDVIDMSVAGESTVSSYQRTSRVISRSPDIVIVALGADDAAKLGNPNAINQYVGMSIAALLEKGIGVVLLGVNAPPGATEDYKARLSGVYDNLGRYYKVAYIPGILNEVISRPDLNLADKYRPNGKGVDAIVEASYDTIGRYMNNVIEQKSALQSYGDETGAPLPAAQPVPEVK